jgi:hypothetical protein
MEPKQTLRYLLLVALVALQLVLFLAPAHARDVPFTTKQIVDGGFTGAISVYTADLDADGDLDVIGAADDPTGDDDVVWWENTVGEDRA